MKLFFTDAAKADLVRLREFIAIKNPGAARKISKKLRAGILRLCDHPNIGVNIPEFPGLQDLVSGDYVVRYTVLEQEIIILRVWHGKENR